MAGNLKVSSVQLGDSVTATQNFVLTSVGDGTAKLSRGNIGATTQDILSVDATGKVTSEQVYVPAGAGAVETTVQSKLRESVSVKDFGAVGDGVADDTAAIQAALTSLSSGSKLVFPLGTYKVTSYLTLSSISNVTIEMIGTVVPTGTLNNVASALFLLTSCSNLTIVPRIINASYASTLNVIRLNACTNVKIVNGTIDVKQIGFDGCGAVQLGANTTGVLIEGNYIRAGYGVIGNDVAGVRNITIVNNEFEGQVAYGTSGPNGTCLGAGDAIEANFPTQSSSEWTITDNSFHNYVGDYANDRYLITGFAYTSNVVVANNRFYDIPYCESIHIEDGSNNISVTGNKISSGIVGINALVNSTRYVSNIAITGNVLSMPAYTPYGSLSIDTGVGIQLTTDQASYGVSNFTISDNTLVGTTGAARGLIVYGAVNGTISNNQISAFPRNGFRVYSATGSAPAVSNMTITGNQCLNCGWNFVLGSLVSGSSFASAIPFTNVRFDDNFATGSLFALDYNIELSSTTGCQIRIPHGSANRKVSAGVVMYEEQPSAFGSNDYTIAVSGESGTPNTFRASNNEIVWSKVGSANTAEITITFASYATANIPTLVQIDAVGMAANASSFEALSAKYLTLHSTSVSGSVNIPTNQTYGSPSISVTQTGLTSTYTVTFTNGFTNCIQCRIMQPNVRDSTLGGVTSIA